MGSVVSLVRRGAVVLAIGVGAPDAVEAQRPPATLVGMVRDSAGTPIPAVEVRFLGADTVAVRTNDSGGFRLPNLPAGTATMSVRRMGFNPAKAEVRLRAGQTDSLVFTLTALPTTIAGVLVEDEHEARSKRMLAGFWERRSRGFGHFLTRDEIVKRDARSFVDLARMIPSVTVALKNGRPDDPLHARDARPRLPAPVRGGRHAHRERLARRVHPGGRRGPRDVCRPLDDPSAVRAAVQQLHLRGRGDLDAAAGDLTRTERGVAPRPGRGGVAESARGATPCGLTQPTRMRRLVLLTLLAAAPLGAQASPRPADLIVTNARIYTVDDARPVVAAMAVRDGTHRRSSARRARRWRSRAPPRACVDLGGRTVIPGMVDAHAHLLGLGQSLAHRQPRRREVVRRGHRPRRRARARRCPPGTWILGRGWDQNQWGDTRFPTHEALTRALPNNPVYLTRVDGHAGLANAAAMRAARRDRGARRIRAAADRARRDAASRPACSSTTRRSSSSGRSRQPTRDETRARASRAAIAESHRWGLVGLHDAGESRATIDLMEEMAKAGELTFRLYVMIGDDSAAIAHYLARGPQSGLYDDHLWIRAIKLYADGALGSRGAALLEPYSDDPNNSGLLVSAPGAHPGRRRARARAPASR